MANAIVWFLQDTITEIAIWLLKFVNRKKDTSLSQRLFTLAESYNKKPGMNNYSSRVLK